MDEEYMTVRGGGGGHSTNNNDNNDDDDDDSEAVEDKEDKDESDENEPMEEDRDDDEEDNDEEEEEEEEEDDSEKGERLSDEEISALRAKVQANKYDYEAHKQYVSALRRASYWQELRQAREDMSETFPLTEELWTKWLKDEIAQAKAASADNEEDGESSNNNNGDQQDANDKRAAVVALFERAVGDYLSVKIWFQYAAYLLEDSSGTDMDKVREVFDRALTAVGLHFTEADMLWSSYINLEKLLVANSPDPAKANERIRNLYKRYLSIPHESIEDTLAEYQEWEASVAVSSGEGEQGAAQQLETNLKTMAVFYEKAKQEALLRQPFEASLKETQDSLDTFVRYIEFEKKQRPHDVFRVRILYERALRRHCLLPDLWLQYVFHMTQHMKVSSVILPIHERSIRNCPWVGDLWATYVLSFEKFHKSAEEIAALYQRALAAGLQTADEAIKVHLAYCDYHRRRVDSADTGADEGHVAALRDAFRNAVASVEMFYPGADPLCRVQQYWARTEAGKLRNMGNARDIMNSALKSNSTSSALWLEFIQLERYYGDDLKKCTQLFKQAVSKQLDDPYRVFSEWLSFERENGSLDSYDLAAEKVQLHSENLFQQQAKMLEKQQKQAEAGALADAARKEEKKTLSSKRKRERGQETRAEKMHGKRPRTAAVESDGKELRPFINEDLRDFAVFVSNLGFHEDEHSIRHFFEEKCGTVTSVHLQRDPVNSKSRGFGDVQFENKESVTKALRLDREKLNGRPVYVSPWINKKKGEKTNFQFPTGKDDKTVFVSNLPKDTETSQIEKVFAQVGDMKQVRHLMTRSGRSRGLAYVEYLNSDAASKAVATLNGYKLGDNAISVAISDPHKKPDAPSFSRGQGRSMVALVPRSVAQKPGPSSSASSSASAASTNTSESSSSNATTTTMTSGGAQKSNADFRKMLLG